MSQRNQVRFVLLLMMLLSLSTAATWWWRRAPERIQVEWIPSPVVRAQESTGAEAPSELYGPQRPSAVENGVVANESVQASALRLASTQTGVAAGEGRSQVVHNRCTGPDGQQLLDLNLATQAELETLPGIGPTLALAIIDERTSRGVFEGIEELLAVKGIGPARFARIAPLVCAQATDVS